MSVARPMITAPGAQVEVPSKEFGHWVLAPAFETTVPSGKVHSRLSISRPEVSTSPSTTSRSSSVPVLVTSMRMSRVDPGA